MQKVILRDATIADLDQLVEFMRNLQADDPWSCEFTDAGARKAVEELLRNPSSGRAWLICLDGEAIGYIVLTFDYSLEYRGKCAWVDEFFIRKESRGKGLGSQALQIFSEKARELGAKTVHLEVNRGNPAIDLYRRAGFADHGRYLMTRWLVERD